MKYIMVDYEHLAPTFDLPDSDDANLFVFASVDQSEISAELSDEIKALGEMAEYIKVSGSEKNAVGLHIAYLIGKLADRDCWAEFEIISNDKVFDPLVEYLTENRIQVVRQNLMQRRLADMQAGKGTTLEEVFRIADEEQADSPSSIKG